MTDFPKRVNGWVFNGLLRAMHMEIHLALSGANVLVVPLWLSHIKIGLSLRDICVQL